MRISTLIEHSAELIRIVYNSPQPSDKILSDFFRAKKQYGSKERRFVVNTIYFVLRNLLLLEYLTEKIPGNLKERFNVNSWKVIYSILLAKEFPLFFLTYSPDELISKVENGENSLSILKILLEDDFEEMNELVKNEYINLRKNIESIKNISDFNNQIREIVILFSFPEYLLNKIKFSFHSISEIFQFLQNSLEQAPLILRVNDLKINQSEVLKELNKTEIEIKESETIQNCLYSFNRIQLSENQLYKEGKIEVQDEGSQLISIILDPKENEIILDACAGAGGKSIHIATLQKNNGLIIANDIEFHRLKEITKRCERAGITSVIPYLSKKGINNFERILKITKGHLFDKVLIDAPCSGAGTIRRDPLKKYKINSRMLDKINLNQLKILKDYSKYLRPGGILVYSTCSTLPDENEKIIEQFLNDNSEFIPQEISLINSSIKNFEKIRVNGNYANIDFRNTISDGFFMAKLQRKN